MSTSDAVYEVSESECSTRGPAVETEARSTTPKAPSGGTSELRWEWDLTIYTPSDTFTAESRRHHDRQGGYSKRVVIRYWMNTPEHNVRKESPWYVKLSLLSPSRHGSPTHSAPYQAKISTTVVHPAILAYAITVNPSASTILTSTPFSSSNCTTSAAPRSHASNSVRNVS